MKREGCVSKFEQSRGSEGGWSPVAFKFSSILFFVKAPGLGSGTLRVLYLSVERGWAWASGRERPPSTE